MDPRRSTLNSLWVILKAAEAASDISHTLQYNHVSNSNEQVLTDAHTKLRKAYYDIRQMWSQLHQEIEAEDKALLESAKRNARLAAESVEEVMA